MDVDVRNDGTQFDKNVKNMENLIKLCLQRLVMSFKALQSSGDAEEGSQRKASLTADNSVSNAEIGATSVTPIEEKNEIEEETSIEEMLAFVQSLEQVLTDEKTDKLIAKTKQVFTVKGQHDYSEETQTRQKLQSCQESLQQMLTGIQSAVARVELFLRSMVKFSYLSQRVFIHLIYQGFCG